MANETLYSSVANERTASVLAQEFILLLAARGSLPMHPALIFGGDIAGKGSSTIGVPQVGMYGYDLMTSVADGAAVGNTAITDAVASLAPTRYALSREPSDLARWTDPAQGVINPAAFARDAVGSWNATMLYALAQMGSGFATNSGSSGNNMTAAIHLGAVIALEMANTPGPYLAVYHSRQVGDLKLDVAATTGGAIQWKTETQDLLEMVGEGSKGHYLGADILQSNHVPPVSTTDYSGFMFGKGAVVWGVCSVTPEGADQTAIGPWLLFERERNSKAGLTAYVTSAFLDFAEAIDLAGTYVPTDY